MPSAQCMPPWHGSGHGSCISSTYPIQQHTTHVCVCTTQHRHCGGVHVSCQARITSDRHYCGQHMQHSRQPPSVCCFSPSRGIRVHCHNSGYVCMSPMLGGSASSPRVKSCPQHGYGLSHPTSYVCLHGRVSSVSHCGAYGSRSSTSVHSCVTSTSPRVDVMHHPTPPGHRVSCICSITHACC